MVNWENTEYVNPRQRKMKDLETEKIYTFEIQDDPDNIVKQSQTPVRAENLNKMQIDLVDDMSKNYTGTNITADTVEGYGIINKLYGDTVQTGTGDKSPDNPYKIECIGDDINLFDGVNGERTNKYINDSGQEVTGQSSDVFIKQVISVASNRLIMSYEGRIAEPVIRCSYFNRDTFISREVSGENNHVFNVPENTSKIDIRVDSRADNLFQNLKLQFGTVATTYSPYNKGTVVVTSSNNSNTSPNVVYTNKPLCCLKDSEGNIVLQDYIDYKRGKIVRQCGYKILNGTEAWYKGGLSEWTNSSHLFWTKIDDNSAFDYNISNQFTLDNINTVVHSTTKNHIFAMYNYNSSYNIVFLDKNSADANAFKQKLAKNNMILVYKLATPVEEDIECTDKIVQYADSTTIQSDAKVEVTLTNNKTINQIYEDISKTNEEIMYKKIDYEKYSSKITDLNNLIESGVYMINLSGVANAPASNVVGNLMVSVTEYSSSSKYINQTFYCTDNAKTRVFSRIGQMSLNVISWFDWKEFVSLDRLSDWGLSGRCKSVSGDWNTACGTATGFYMGQGLKNAPDNYNWFFVIHLVHNDRYIRQLAFSFTDNIINSRKKDNGTWSSWVQITG